MVLQEEVNSWEVRKWWLTRFDADIPIDLCLWCQLFLVVKIQIQRLLKSIFFGSRMKRIF